MANFTLIGAAGYIAPKHFRAIKDTGNTLVAAADPHDSVGIMDRFFLDAAFFTEIERFDRYLEKARRGPEQERVHYVSICTPNYLHDAHVRLALRVKAHAICEKPLVINPWNLDALADLEEESGCRVYTVLQLRTHPSIIALKERLESHRDRHAEVCLTYVTRRGRWYDYSWKGSEQKSGSVAMNIGVHFFDMLLWLFGGVRKSEVHLSTPQKIAGKLELERATVRWFLSIDANDLPEECCGNEQPAFRSITIGGEEMEFSGGFTDLHTRVYEKILAGEGSGIEDARPSIQLVHDIRHSNIVLPGGDAHPFLVK